MLQRTTIAAIMCALPLQTVARPVAPTATDQELVEAALRPNLRDPTSLKGDLLSITDPLTFITWICGDVRAANGFGGVADPVPIVAMLADDPLSGIREVKSLKLGDTPEKSKIIGELCVDQFEFVSSFEAASASVQDALEATSRSYFFCRAGDEQSCALEREAGDTLRAAGWCSVDSHGSWRPC